MNEKLSERVRARPYGKCYLDKNDMKVIAEVEALVSRLAKANSLLVDNYPCYDEDRCKNCVGGFGEIDYRTCVGYNSLKALRGEAEEK